MTEYSPLLLERRLESRVWGGNTLGEWLGFDSAPPQLAEVWLVYEDNRILNGPWAGQTLAEVVKEHGANLVGSTTIERYGPEFPLLAKFLDAADHLSVQVHPDDDYAHRIEAGSGFHGKTEAWYILQATPEARLIHGWHTATDRATVKAAASAGTILDLVRYVPARVGETIFVPAGTVHAINAGVMLFEIQQKSDLTYRVFDYGRGRELHLQRALDVIDYRAAPPALCRPEQLSAQRTLLIVCPCFSMEHWQLQERIEARTLSTSFEILTIIGGDGTLSWAGGELIVRQGDALVLPAALGSYWLEPQSELALLRCYVA